MSQTTPSSPKNPSLVNLKFSNKVSELAKYFTPSEGEGAKTPPRCVPSKDAFLTGSEFRRDVLLPLASYLQATGRCTIQEHCSVVGLARGHLLKKEGIGAVGDSRRETLPFRALLRRNDDEAWEEALAVVDCSGTYAPESTS